MVHPGRPIFGQKKISTCFEEQCKILKIVDALISEDLTALSRFLKLVHRVTSEQQ